MGTGMFSSLLQTTVKSRDSKLSWLALGAATVLMFSSFGFLRNFGIFYNSFLQQYGDYKEKTAWVGSIPLSLMFILSPVAVLVLNKSSLRLCSAVAAIPTGLSLLATSFATNLTETFFTYSIPFGLASCMMSMVANKAVYTYFDKRLSTAFGLLTGGCSLAQVGLSYIIIFLLNNVGMERTFQVLAAVFSCICLLSSQAFFPTNFQSEQKSTISRERGVRLFLRLLKNKALCLFLFANFICCFAYAVSSVHQVQLAIEYGVAESLARQFPAFTAIGISLGRLSAGFIIDSGMFRLINYYQSALFLNGLAAIVGSFSSSQTHLLIYIWVFSFLDGQMQVACTPMVREVVGLEYMSEAFSMLLTADAISVMVGPPILGFIVDKTKDYQAFFYVAGIPPLLSCLIIIPLRYMTRDNIKDEDVNEKLTNEHETDVTRNEKDIGKLIHLETPV